VPLAVDWPDEFFSHAAEPVRVRIGDSEAPFYDAEIGLTDHKADGPIRLRIAVASSAAEYEVQFSESGVRYEARSEAKVDLRRRRITSSLPDVFARQWPLFMFEGGAVLEGSRLYRPAPMDRSPFDAARIVEWDWSGTDVSVESQTVAKRKESIQYRVIQHLLSASPSFDLVVDDDDSYEAADVVAIRAVDDRLVVELYHCKYSSDALPGARVLDLYAVVGQAQRSVRWRGYVDMLFRHLAQRDLDRFNATGVSRLERGTRARLSELWKRAPILRPEFTIYVVQPGLSRGKAVRSQLDLLAATEVFLRDTYNVAFAVIGSP
jgi:hypothetical protein